MYVVKSNEEAASAFISATCQLNPKSFSPPSDHMHNTGSAEETLSKYYMIVCGSQAEFYIRPLNTCVVDLDVLFCSTDQLTFTGDTPLLPSDISGGADKIHCYKIESCREFPGFIRLRDYGELKYNWIHKEYELSRQIKLYNYVILDKIYIL